MVHLEPPPLESQTTAPALLDIIYISNLSAEPRASQTQYDVDTSPFQALQLEHEKLV
jgi:hypothetical protein